MTMCNFQLFSVLSFTEVDTASVIVHKNFDVRNCRRKLQEELMIHIFLKCLPLYKTYKIVLHRIYQYL